MKTVKDRYCQSYS